MNTVWLSYPMSETAPRPPAIPAPALSEFQSIARDGANVQFLQCYNHTGTHLDTAAHVLEGGASITEFAPEELIYHKILVLDLSHLPDDTVIEPEHLQALSFDAEVQALVVRFGVEERRKNQPEMFSKHCPGFGIPAAEFIHKQLPALRMIGTDVPSISCIAHLESTMQSHNAFFEKASTPHFIIIEEMKLDRPLDGLKKLTVSPWMVEGMNSGPCVIWAEYDS